ncbi:MAG: phosphoglycerate dehydrogenase [Anaerosomatales bacterium]|nr:phosphoglycerate dehydrogenase [Anaerosomatales bacterium]
MKVLVAEKIAAAGIERLKREFEVDVKLELTPEQLVAEIPAYDGLIVRSATRATREVIEAGTNLKIIGRAGVGVDNVDVQAATERGVIVCNAPTSNIVSAAEHTIALMLAQARNIPQANASMKQCKWERSKFTGTEVLDKTLGVVGLGRIGALVAERARGLGMKVLAYDPYVSEERAAQMGIELATSLEDLLPRADFLTVHLPKTKETIGMFGAEQFALMKDGVRLMNTARGGIYQEQALIDALESGKVASAGVDVYEVEPCTDSPLFAYDQVIVTPHLGASTSEAQDRAGEQIAEYVAAGLNGEMVSTAVNIAPVAPEVMEQVGPFIPLAEAMGSALGQIVRGHVSDLHVHFIGQLSGQDTRILKTALLKGLLTAVTQDSINFVNANLYAEQRGIQLEEHKRPESFDYVSVMVIEASTEAGPIKLGATLVGKKNEPRIILFNDFELDMAPSTCMAFLQYEDVPGVIGKVGTALGEAKINIGSMHVGRTEEGGTALMGINVDSPISSELLDRIATQVGATNAWSVEL